MDIQQVRKGLKQLGDALQAAGETRYNHLDKNLQAVGRKLESLISQAFMENYWFTENNVRFAFLANGWMLQEAEKADYISEKNQANTIAIVPPALAPLDGLKDVAIALLTGSKVQFKQMFVKEKLMPGIIDALYDINPEFKKLIYFQQNQLKEFNRVIVTIPSDRNEQWEKYFTQYPGKIRRASYSAAVVTGKETLNQLEAIGSDVFRYFGRSFENIYKLYVPKNYRTDMFFEAFEPFGPEMKQHTQYFNNFEYNKSIYLINTENNVDNGFLIFKEDKELQSRIGVLHLHRYEDENELQKIINRDHEQLNKLVSIKEMKEVATTAPGEALKPSLNDLDAMETVNKINF